ncbi:MAG TPA: hypothetical protein VJR89_34330, partial [Polyangiales bacterium]|nr:hypothetical protein [Polyangiales bacterium]
AGAFSVQASGIATLAQRTGIGGATVQTSALGGEVLGCGQAILGVIGARLCAGLGAASIAAQGEQFYEDLHTRRAWLAALARAGVRWPVAAPVALQVALGLHANILRPRLQIVDWAGAQAITSVVGASFGLDVLVGLP